MINANNTIDTRLLWDLYDMASYYSKQLILLDLKSYNGLSNEHKSAHTLAVKEAEILRDIMYIYRNRPELVIVKTETLDDDSSKCLSFYITHSETLTDREQDLVNKYVATVIIENREGSDAVTVKLKLGHNQSDTGKETTNENEYIGVEVVYTTQSFRACIVLHFVAKHDDVYKRYPLIAPSITNTVDEYTTKGKGAQDSHLLVPDLHSRVLDLVVKLDNIYLEK